MILPAATMLSLLPYGLNAAQPVSVSGSRWEERVPLLQLLGDPIGWNPVIGPCLTAEEVGLIML